MTVNEENSEESMSLRASNTVQNEETISSSASKRPQLDTDDTEVTAEPTKVSKKPRKLRSKVWNEMERVQTEKTGPDGKKTFITKGICNYCKKSFDAESANRTSHLDYHLRTCRSKPENRPGKAKLTTIKTGNEGTKLANWKYDPEVTRLLVVKMISKHDYPLNMVEHAYFREFVKSLNPSAKILGRNTYREDTLKVYAQFKHQLEQHLDSLASKCSLTTDMWTSKHTRDGYCCVTCHYIDDDWTLHKKILAYVLVPSPHTGEVLGDVVRAIALEWNIDNKFFALAADNASSNDVMMINIKYWLCSKNCLVLGGEMFQMRCSIHILHLVVMQGMKVASLFIARIRECVKYIKSSQSRKEKFESALMQVKLPIQCVSLDVDTRWNSTYMMLKNAIDLRQGFVHLAELDDDFNKCLPNSEDWEQGINICDCLKVFNDITNRFSGIKYPTTNLYYNGVYEVNKSIRTWEFSHHIYIREMALKMREKFDSYWSTTNLLMSIGVVLDPRYKLRWVEFVYRKLYGEHLSLAHINKFRQSLDILFSSYESQSGSSVPDYFGSSSKSGIGSSNLENIHVTSEAALEYDEFMMQNSDVEVHKSELDRYLEEPLLTITKGNAELKFDILSWWKIHASNYPTIAKIARDVLDVPVTTVASESTISAGGRVLTTDMSSLAPEVVQALLCLNDWLPNLNGEGSTVADCEKDKDEGRSKSCVK